MKRHNHHHHNNHHHRRGFRAPLLAALSLGLAGTAFAQAPGMGGPDGERMGGGRGFERMAERMKERCEKFEARLEGMDKKLTTEQVRDIVAGQLAQAGNANLKIGKVQAKADGVVAFEIVTKTGALVNSREISTKTGLPVEMSKRCDNIEARIEKASQRREGRGRGRGGRMSEAFALMGTERGPDRDLNLTAAQIKTLAEARLIINGNPNLKVGAVKEKDAETYTVDIVAADNSIVVQREVNKRTGRVDRD
jgi:phage shock protein A